MPPPLDADVLARIEVLRGRRFTVSELTGGLTNANYRVRTTDDLTAPDRAPLDLVVRVSANESSGLLAIDREAEYSNTRAACEAGVGAPVVQVLPADSVLVIGFLPGRTLEPADLRDPALIPRVAAAIRQLHSGPAFVGTFDMRAIRRRYLDIVRSKGFRLPAGYDALATRVEALEEAMKPGNEPLVPCNNDLLAGNFIDDGERIAIIDYEYGGMNEASFELGNAAAESKLDDAQTAAMVAAYWGKDSAEKLARAQAWSLLARYGWTLWASIQDGVSPIDFDFWSWGMEKYSSAEEELHSPRYDHMIAALAEGSHR